MSIMNSVSSVTKAQTAPLAPAGTMAAAALMRPSELSVEASGRSCPHGNIVRNASLALGTTVTLTEYACAVAGMPQAPSGTVNPRADPAVKNGAPNGPAGFRVSTTRQGVTGTKRKPAIWVLSKAMLLVKLASLIPETVTTLVTVEGESGDTFTLKEIGG